MILEISVAVFVVVFVVGLLIVLFQFRRTAREAEKILDTTRQQIAPISHDLTIVVNDVKKIVQSIRQQMDMVEGSVGEIKQTITRVNEFERVLQEKLQQPIIEFATLISAISRSLRAFINVWKR